jgi:hypothetical protein
VDILFTAVGVVVLVPAVVVVRLGIYSRAVAKGLADLCHKLEVPNVPFDRDDAVRQVLAGTRPGLPRDGQWWVARGLGQTGQPARTRLVAEEAAPTLGAVQAKVSAMFAQFAGDAPAQSGDHLLGPIVDVHRGVLIARTTGIVRPLEGWLVAVPPDLIGADRGQ